ncbi:P-type Mg2+ transporter [Entomortierella parvispora]|uniref:Magnesium-transporting ATPase, P-type 1 n=1 Tax=Entomortierella parvispora TaxID=205924 RepID=A0A9P3H9Y8_9FUNG|nr:P-type Mg2+ transporter [Entomortierella parvispora]
MAPSNGPAMNTHKTIEALRAHHGVVYDTVTSLSSITSSLPATSEFAGLLPLNEEQVERQKAIHGRNIISFGNEQVWYKVLYHALVHPFNILLFLLAVATIATGDEKGASVMFVMILISTVLRFWQEWKSAAAAKSLKSMVSTLITVTRLYACPESRDPTPEDVIRIMNHATVRVDIPIEDVVPGDWVQLSAGDLIPADVQVIESKDLFVSQAALTGEAMPVEKFSASSEAMAAWTENQEQQNSYEDMARQAVPKNASTIAIEKDIREDADAAAYGAGLTSSKQRLSSTYTEPTGMAAFKLSMMRSLYACFGIRRFDPESGDANNADIDLGRPDRCYMGTSVVSGTATVLVEKIGAETFFGSMAQELSKRKPENAFQMGVRNISWVFFILMAIMVPPVLLINGFVHQSWKDAALFALSVAVGLTPEMLPMIVNSNLARGAYLMSKKRCIVKNLDAIINLGSMDVLCTDKTGTLTDNKVVLVRHLDFHGKASIHSLQLAFLNSRFQTGLKNLLDVAVVEYFEKTASALPMYESLGEDAPPMGSGLTPAAVTFAARYLKLDEIPFDFVRRRMSVVLRDLSDNQAMMVSKGAVEEMLRICTKIVIPRGSAIQSSSDIQMSAASENTTALDLLDRPVEDQIQTLTSEMIEQLVEMNKGLNVDGLRVVAVAYKTLDKVKDNYGLQDESDMVFAGLIGFLDPPKESTGPAIKELMSLGVEIKVLTGDSAAVCRKVCQEINLPVKSIVSTEDLIGLDDEQIAELAQGATIFAKLTPLQKSLVIRSLKRKDHVVGFLGDGINDAPALAEADVGISVDTATDIAKESADVILLEKSLMVIAESVVLGRTTYGNTMKYIMMAISSNFGNVFSMLVASSWLPFLPMQPIHILTQNLLYDLSQTTIPWDHMDPEFLKVPHRWSIKSIMRFMVFMGPWSSIFDITTFLFMWYYFNIKTADNPDVTLFQTAWFTEGALSQLLVIYVIRTPKVAFVQSMASRPVIFGSLLISAIVLALPYIPAFQQLLTMVELPAIFYGYLAGALACYLLITQGAKMMYLRLFNDEWF